MAGELETVVREFYAAAGRGDFRALLEMCAEDTQWVNEVSRSWIR